MNALMTLSRPKLAAVLSRLESPFDGEKLAAAEAASRLVRGAGLSWHDVVAAPPPESQSADWRRLLTEAQSRPGLLTAWEAQFLGNLGGFRRLSGRQLAVLHRLAERARGAGS